LLVLVVVVPLSLPVLCCGRMTSSRKSDSLDRYTFTMMAVNCFGWMAWFGWYLHLVWQHNALPRHVDPQHPATSYKATRKMITKLQVRTLRFALVFLFLLTCFWFGFVMVYLLRGSLHESNTVTSFG